MLKCGKFNDREEKTGMELQNQAALILIDQQKASFTPGSALVTTLRQSCACWSYWRYGDTRRDR